MGERDGQQHRNQPHEHVHHREHAIDGGSGVEVGEVIYGGDECVPWEEITCTECEVDDVGQVECVPRDLVWVGG